MPDSPSKRKRVYRVEFEITEVPTEYDDYSGAEFIKKEMRDMILNWFGNNFWLDFKNLKIRRVKA